MTDREVLETFGKMVIEGARERCLRQIERLLNGEIQGPAHNTLRELVPGYTPEKHEEYMELVAYVVGNTLAFIMGTFEESNLYGLDVQVKDEDGTLHSLSEISDGLEGELYSKQGWIMRYGKLYVKEYLDEHP